MEPRKLTKEDIDKVRGVDGFPIGSDEDIIALSDAPYYTACPNPFIDEFIKENGTPYNESTDDYSVEPYTDDVSEGKHDPFYMAHGYHTKVPYMAIMRYILHYTKPGDIVLDAFSGTGMAGVAALQCGSDDMVVRAHVGGLSEKVQWGKRNAIISDLSPIAAFISSNYTSKLDMMKFSNIVTNILDQIQNEYGWMFETEIDGTKHSVNYIVWSDVYVCKNCSQEFLYPVEAEMKQQLANAKKYKDVIREEKDLTRLVGTESDFDVDVALRTMMTFYECWQGNDPRLIDRISIGDAEITKHLKTEILQDRTTPLLSVSIANFPNEAGYFMLWELSISEDESGKRILPIFVNDAGILRPMAGKRLMEVFLDGTSRLTIGSAPNMTAEEYAKLEKLSMEFAYDTFMELKEKQLQLNQESYNKYMYALQLRTEAAQHIGIENIRRGRLAKLEKEKAAIEAEHKKGAQVYPDFRLMLAVRLEA